MSRKGTKKAFDCVQFKRKAQEKIYSLVRNLSLEEPVEFFRRAAESGPLAEWWRKVRGYRRPSRAPGNGRRSGR
jgi:hypothetical protein